MVKSVKLLLNYLLEIHKGVLLRFLCPSRFAWTLQSTIRFKTRWRKQGIPGGMISQRTKYAQMSSAQDAINAAAGDDTKVRDTTLVGTGTTAITPASSLRPPLWHDSHVSFTSHGTYLHFAK